MKKALLMIFLFTFCIVIFHDNCFGDDVSDFLNFVQPELLSIQNEIPDIQQAFKKTGEVPLDTLTFAYRQSIRKMELETGKIIPFGQWSQEIKQQVIVNLSLLCVIKDFLHIKKQKTYQEEMNAIRPSITRGSYMKMIDDLSFTRNAYGITLERLQKGPPLQNIDQVLSPLGVDIIQKNKW